MDYNDFSKNRFAVYSKYTPEFREHKPKPHPLEGTRFAKGGRMQDPLRATKQSQNQELVKVENAAMNEPEAAAEPVIADPAPPVMPAARKPKPKRDKPLWPDIVWLLRQHPDGLDRETIARELGEIPQAVSSALGKARKFQPDSLSLVDGRWVLRRVPEGMQGDPWDLSGAVERVFAPPKPELPEFDQAAEFVEAVREIARRVMATDERLAALLHSGAEWAEQVEKARTGA